MPPKKQDKNTKGAANVMIDEDLSDVANLPLLHDFVFTNLYAFKFRKNLATMEKALLKEFYVSGDTNETAELARRRKVIQKADLLNQAKARQYMTDAESESLGDIDEVRLRQVLARTTNELLAGFSVPLRRAKLEEEEKFQEQLEKMSDNGAKKDSSQKRRKEQLEAYLEGGPELQIWLKDFPKTVEDFRELRRSAAQHQPDVETAIHGVFLIEEKIPVDFEEEEDMMTVMAASSVVSQNEDPEDPEVKKKREQFDKQERIDARKLAIYMNRFAKNCPFSSQMRLLTPMKSTFVGPDPPMIRVEPSAEELEAKEKEQAAAKKKGAQEVEVAEVEKNPEEEAEDLMFSNFVDNYCEKIVEVANELAEYRELLHPDFGVKKIPLYPKVLTLQQQQSLDVMKAEAKRMEEEENAQREKEAQAESQLANQKPGGKPAAAKAKASAKPAPAQKPGSAQSKDSKRPRTGTSVSELRAKEALRNADLRGVDDQEKDWDFSHYNRVVMEMKCGATSVGSILAAMVYQIEEENKQDMQPSLMISPNNGVGAIQDSIQTKRTVTIGQSQMSVHKSEIAELEDMENQMTKDDLVNELEDMYAKLTMEHSVVETSFRHMFSGNVVKAGLKQSPYQTLINASDDIGVRSDSFTFLNGKKQGAYEQACLKKMELPGINERFKMPNKETRQKAERDSDTGAIIKYCELPVSQTQRLIALKGFEDLLKQENPERSYDFLDRNFTERYDSQTFRQIMTDSLRMYPDVNTAYYDKEDSLLVALNFKNPPGRLLRRQWSYPMKVLPDFSIWRNSVKTGDATLTEPLYDIESHKVGLLRTRQKYSFPCDNSVIRVDKNWVAGRRYGSSVVVKDNLCFGIRERDDVVQEKAMGDDELVNMDTRKDSDRRCEFWLEFENGVRMHVEMLEEPSINDEIIPVANNNHWEQPPVGGNVSVADEAIAEHEGADSALSKMSPDVDTKPGSILKQQSQLQAATGSQKNVDQKTEVGFEDATQSAQDVVDDNPEQKAVVALQAQVFDPYNEQTGSCITFTFKEGLISKVLPNGDVQQALISNSAAAKKFAIIQDQNESNNDKKEVQRMVTRKGVVIRTLADGSQILYFQDGSITEVDKRRGLWKTTNGQGVIRERNLRSKTATDQTRRLEFHTKNDPETNATVSVREDGFLRVSYVDRSEMLIFPDHSKILITKSEKDDDSAIHTAVFSMEGYAPVRVTNNPVKARAGTIIGAGGTDALMGKESIMERSHGGLVSELLLPDKTTVQTYLEKQELRGYNRFCRNLIHVVRRDDYSVIKVKQDGEVVLISTNERAYLNDIGAQEEFGKKDYDYFFELFGVPLERRSGLYTVNLEQGRLWTQDEEGNFFIVYANGDSTEKLSVSFNLDQMVEGIENKEPDSPRISDGEYIEQECKFLPPPKTVSHPRLFCVDSNGATEYSNKEQLDYLFLCHLKDTDFHKTQQKVNLDNEDAVCHRFTRQEKTFNPANPAQLQPSPFPKMPQSLEMVNETESIPNEPKNTRYMWRHITEFKQPAQDQFDNFRQALVQKDTLRKEQSEETSRLKVVNPQKMDDKEFANQCKIMLRIARARGIPVQTLLGEEYKPIKKIETDEIREAAMASLDDHFMPGGGAEEHGESGSTYD